jgi:hypothetical protein
MIDDSIGIRMCRNKKVRKDLGTITYQESKIVLSDPKAHYDEIHALIKKEKKKQNKYKSEPKIVDIKKMTKEEQIKELVELPINESTKIDSLSTEKSKDKELFMDEPIEIKSGTNKQEKAKEEVKEGVKEVKEGVKEVKEVKDNPIQEGGRSLMKKIYVTDLSVDKDKEMFQM